MLRCDERYILTLGLVFHILTVLKDDIMTVTGHCIFQVPCTSRKLYVSHSRALESLGMWGNPANTKLMIIKSKEQKW